MTSARSTFLVDTSVLVYAYDRNEPAKRQAATRLYADLSASGAGALSVQILGEFFNATTRRLRPRLPIPDAIDAVTDLWFSWRILDLVPQLVIDAMRGVESYRISYYDAMVWATAKHYGVPFLLSEDLNDGQLIEGVRIINPFAKEFDVRILS